MPELKVLLRLPTRASNTNKPRGLRHFIYVRLQACLFNSRHILQYVTGLGKRQLDEEAGEGIGWLAPGNCAVVDFHKTAFLQARHMAAYV